MIYEHHYQPTETVVYEEQVPVEVERIQYEIDPQNVEHRYTKTKVIDIKKSESYGDYKAHCKSLEDAIAKE